MSPLDVFWFMIAPPHIVDLRARYETHRDRRYPGLLLEVLGKKVDFAVENIEAVMPQRAEFGVASLDVHVAGVSHLEALTQSNGYRRLVELPNYRTGIQEVKPDHRLGNLSFDSRGVSQRSYKHSGFAFPSQVLRPQ